MTFWRNWGAVKFGIVQSCINWGWDNLEQTTAASKPTICKTVNSEVRMVGSTQPKNAWWACASWGENAIAQKSQVFGLWGSELRTFELCSGSEKQRPSCTAIGKEKERENSDCCGEWYLGRKPWSFKFDFDWQWAPHGMKDWYSLVGGEPGGNSGSSPALATPKESQFIV